MNIPKIQFGLALIALVLALLAGCSTAPLQEPTEQEPAETPSTDTSEQEDVYGSGVEDELIVTGARVRAANLPKGPKKRRQRSSGTVYSNTEKLVTSARQAVPNTNSDLNNLLNPRYWSSEGRYQVFRDYGVNPTIVTQTKPDSTFALDIDDGSYKLALAMLGEGRLPDPAGIRVEEFVNAQHYRYLSDGGVFSLSAEAMPSPFRQGYHVMHIGVQAKALDEGARLPANIVLVADVSGSMGSDNKLNLLKQSFITLVSQLGRDDRVALVSYSDAAQLVLPPTSAAAKRKIIQAIEQLAIQGSTNAAEGVRLAYQVANTMYQPGLINRIIFSSDGMANVGVTSPEAILSQVKEHKERGIFLTTVGVGLTVYNDTLLEQLANQGNGRYIYIADFDDVQSAFVDQLNAQLYTVAKNAKAQVIFNQEAVSHYRLLGYENRSLEKNDFLDASKDGGEIGAGHRVTALYEVKLSHTFDQVPLASVAIAYQKPEGREVLTIEKSIPASVVSVGDRLASADMQLSTAVAAFAEKLRMSYWSSQYRYEDIMEVLRLLPPEYNSREDIRELQKMVQQASLLDRRSNTYHQHYSRSGYDLDHVPLLK